MYSVVNFNHAEIVKYNLFITIHRPKHIYSAGLNDSSNNKVRHDYTLNCMVNHNAQLKITNLPPLP